ncbi:MAG: hypothetical protein HOV94_06900 [Saccharothrix sp.]|nr:hypothetical protein [Saccharothrix sp.]
MAVPFTTRRTGSLLLRALAVGGLAAAAWLVCAGAATAAENHPDEATKTLDAVNLALGEQHSATAALLAEAPPAHQAPFTPVTTAPQPFGSSSFDAVDPSAVFAVGVGLTEALADHPSAVPSAVPSDEYEAGDPDGYPEDDGYSYSGSASNTIPEAQYEAKVAAKVAARADAPTPLTEAPPQATPPTPVVARTHPAAPMPVPLATPGLAAQTTTPEAGVIWEVPEPSAPAPAQKHAPAPGAPTASAGGADNGGGHRGGVIASFTGESDPKPLAAWSAERRDDGRSPGRVPGLPSTSPD